MPPDADATLWLFLARHFSAVYLLTDKKQGEEAQGEFTVPPPLPQR